MDGTACHFGGVEIKPSETVTLTPDVTIFDGSEIELGIAPRFAPWASEKASASPIPVFRHDGKAEPFRS